jgi:hypothetical protein
MEEADFKKVLELIEKVIHKCHLAALKGLAPHERLRAIATHLEIKYAEKHAKHVEKNIEALNKDIEQHFVTAAQQDEYKILKDIPFIIKDIYKSVFNAMVSEKVEVLNTQDFVEHVVKKIGTAELRKEIAKALLPYVNDFKDNLRALHNGANAVLANARDRKTVALAMTKLFHTQGATYMKRRQEQHLIKDARKDAVKAEGIEARLLKMHFKTKEQADKEIAKMRDLQKRSLAEFTKGSKLLFADWEQAVKYLEDTGVAIEKAAAEHELPTKDPAQIKQISGLIVEKVIEPFVHSIDEGVNQLDRLRKELENEVEKLEKAAA